MLANESWGFLVFMGRFPIGPDDANDFSALGRETL
jgi:hypothetical protein